MNEQQLAIAQGLKDYVVKPGEKNEHMKTLLLNINRLDIAVNEVGKSISDSDMITILKCIALAIQEAKDKTKRNKK